MLSGLVPIVTEDSVTEPKVSVVMGVYNGAAALHETMDSMLSQEGVAFEFIVVNDGSTDKTSDILAEYARVDKRVRIVTQENQGLTKALIAGCGKARTRYIARQDCGDVSLPGRLFHQSEFLDANPHALLTSCGTRYIGPEGEFLYDVCQSANGLQEGLTQLSLDKIQGPSHHGSTMLRRSAYELVGGYRAVFRVAQDLDLWVRLSEVGVCLATAEPLYQARLMPGAISAARRDEQVATTRIILNCAVARKTRGNDTEIVAGLIERAGTRQMAERFNFCDARFYYFIASVLRRKNPRKAWHYYKKAMRAVVSVLERAHEGTAKF